MKRTPTDEQLTELALLIAAFRLEHPEVPDEAVRGTVEVRRIIAEWKRRHDLDKV